MKRWLVRIAWFLLGILVVIQFVPVDRDNPLVTNPIAAPANVQAILKRSCWDCHSNETIWPWYARVAPASWLVAHDVKEGRRHMNLSTWGDSSPAKRRSKAGEMSDEVEADAMPPFPYTLLHRDARLSPEDKKVLTAWAEDLQ